MKYLAVFAAALIVAAPCAIASNEHGMSRSDGGATRTDVSQDTIRSREQLFAHMARTPASPLSALSPTARTSFLNSLVFTAKGLGSFSADALSGLPPGSVRQVLGLFALESEARTVRTSAGTNTLNRSAPPSFRRPPPRRWGKSCILFPGGTKGKCVKSPGYRCSHLCG
jgi:hypothetical protein